MNVCYGDPCPFYNTTRGLNFHFRFNKLQDVFDITREQCKLEREHRRALTPFVLYVF